jgi:hypothetical protein
MHEPAFASVYAYLLLSTTLFVVWLVLYGKRSDLRRRAAPLFGDCTGDREPARRSGPGPDGARRQVRPPGTAGQQDVLKEFRMVTASAAIDMARARQRKRDMVDGLIAGRLARLRPGRPPEPRDHAPALRKGPPFRLGPSSLPNRGTERATVRERVANGTGGQRIGRHSSRL